MRLAGVALAGLAGSALQLQQPALWPLWAYAAAIVVALLAWPARRSALVLGLAAASLAFGLTGWRAHDRLGDVLPSALEGRDLVFTGVVERMPRALPHGTRFMFAVEHATLEGRAVQVPRHVALGWYRGWHDEALIAGPEADLRAGQRWRFTVRLKQPHGSVNPNGFDYELWLFEQGIRATGYVRATHGAAAERLDEAAGYAVERARQAIRDAISARVEDPRAAGVLAALAVGDQAAIERGDWDVFRATGVAHLVAISGLHVTMFAWLAGGLIGWAWRRSERLVLRCPAPLIARWGGLVAAAGYALLAGWGVPAQRTVWMLATAALLATLGVRWPWPLVLLSAAVVVTALDPWALLQPGFWLSFVAVGLLIVSAPAQAEAPAGWRARFVATLRSGLRTQAIATLGLAPLTLVFFQQVSLIGFVANLVAIPLVTLVVTPLALLGVLLPPLWQLGGWVVQALVHGLAGLASWPGAVWTAAIAPPWAQAAGLLAGALLVLPLPWRLRLLGVPLLLPLLWPLPPRPAEGGFELVAADVGQGTAVIVRTREHLLVYDTGPQYSRDTDAGQRVLLPLLRTRGEQRVDLLVLSHRDIDHVGGAASVLAGLPVERMLGSLEPSHALRSQGVPFDDCAAGRQWRWDGVAFEVLHPRPGANDAKPNALSCVLRIIDARGRSVLLAGDIEAAQEAALVAAHGDALASEVLLVPHHGSRTSSTDGFIQAVAPRLAVVQAGYRNRFGHPAPDVVQRYAARGVGVVHTAMCGAWRWYGDETTCEREAAARYWHHGLEVASDAITPRRSPWPSMSP